MVNHSLEPFNKIHFEIFLRILKFSAKVSTFRLGSLQGSKDDVTNRDASCTLGAKSSILISLIRNDWVVYFTLQVNLCNPEAEFRLIAKTVSSPFH